MPKASPIVSIQVDGKELYCVATRPILKPKPVQTAAIMLLVYGHHSKPLHGKNVDLRAQGMATEMATVIR